MKIIIKTKTIRLIIIYVNILIKTFVVCKCNFIKFRRKIINTTYYVSYINLKIVNYFLCELRHSNF